MTAHHQGSVAGNEEGQEKNQENGIGKKGYEEEEEKQVCVKKVVIKAEGKIVDPWTVPTGDEDERNDLGKANSILANLPHT
ncbi:uncharacterized protein G2W53_015541 [Senna tora]|uniref:Uncharacterized protein n=1 Tax=Senna tora TaxID=362788 RepID=A0A834WVN5_9FABA|nr:uncharacterized protein G2W53_015541 [Senna tora]